MAPYKVTYFNITALGEPIRFILSYGGLEFEDVRIEKENWPQLKDKTPFGQLPTIEFNGKVFNQCASICRYLAKQVKLAGNNDLENLEIDVMVDTINDLRQLLGKYHYEANEEIKKSMKDELFKVRVPYLLERLDKVAAANKGHFALSRLTWADLFFVSLLDYINIMAGSDITENYPNLIAIKNNVVNVPQIKGWLEKRPKTLL